MSFGPCMCGDTHCPSCGPAQGNWKCPICKAWADDGCEHFDEQGELLPQFKEEADKKEADENAYWEQYAKEFSEE